MPLPEDYLAALEALASVFESYSRATGGIAVLVGGGATAIYTAGEFPSGDFDVVAAGDDALRAAFLENGFRREDGRGLLRGGFYHPDHPLYGFQHVSGRLFEGRSEQSRLVKVVVAETGEGIILPSIEDLIADRLAQHAIASPTDDSRLLQARLLFSLAPDLDREYLLRRICDESGDPALIGLGET